MKTSLLDRWRARRRRARERGAVAVEFALSLFFLVPLLLGTLDYGYYFWVGVNAMEAARAGARKAVNSGPGLTSCVGGVMNNNPAIDATARSDGATVAIAQMGHVFATPATYTTVVQTCTLVGVANIPAWSIQVQIDFPPAVGFLNPWMPASPNTSTCPGCVRYYTPALVSPR
jgi:Flp pilus assembly protein TadG